MTKTGIEKSIMLGCELLLALLLVSCVEIKNQDDGGQPAKNQASPGMSQQILEGKGINQFQVRLHLPEGNFILRRHQLGRNSSEDLQSVVSGEYLDEHVEAGESYSYQAGVRNGADFVKIHELQVRIPVDLWVQGLWIVSGPKDIQLLKNLRHLLISKGGQILTNGQSLVIRAEDLDSEDGQILTFQEGQQAPQGSFGRSAGEVTVIAKTAKGHLDIEMRGENGGVGMNVEAPIVPATALSYQAGPAGQAGKEGGNSGILNLQLPNELIVQIHHTPGIGGAGSAGKPGFGVGYRGTTYPTAAGPSGPSGQSGAIGTTCTLANEISIGCY